jgi:hypothetical protein
LLASTQRLFYKIGAFQKRDPLGKAFPPDHPKMVFRNGKLTYKKSGLLEGQAIDLFFFDRLREAPVDFFNVHKSSFLSLDFDAPKLNIQV